MVSEIRIKLPFDCPIITNPGIDPEKIAQHYINVAILERTRIYWPQAPGTVISETQPLPDGSHIIMLFIEYNLPIESV